MCCPGSDNDTRRVGAGISRFILILAGIFLLILAGILLPLAFSQDAKVQPTPSTAEEWYGWFGEQKGAVVKSDTTVRGGKDIRPLLSEITLSDAKLLPEGIWGVRKYRRYIAGPGGLWNQGTFYELIKLPTDASAKSSAISWEATVSKDPKYSSIAEVAPK